MGLFGLGKAPGLGVDLSVDTIKALELTAHGESYTISQLAELQLPENLITEDDITDVERLGKQLEKLRKKLGSKTKQVVAAVSGNQAISKQIAVSADLDDEAIAEKIEAEAEALIPFPINEVRYDFESLGPHPSLAGQQRVLVTATRTVTVDTRVEALEQGGFEVKIMDVDTQAILRACNHLLPHLAPDLVDNEQPLLIIDLSVTGLHMMIVEQGEISYTRYQSEGLERLFNGLDEDKSISHSELFAKFRANELDGFPELFIADYLSGLWTQISRGVQLYKNNLLEAGFAAMVVVNSGAMVPAVLETLKSNVQYPVLPLNPFDHFELPESSAHLHPHGPRFVEALGLALRSFTPWHT